MAEFLARLKQRKLVQWAIAYVAGAWAVLQVLDLVAQEFGWPGTVMRIITVVLGIGFFVALVLAWYHGERGAQRVGGIELLMLAALLVIAAVAVSWVRHEHRVEAPAVAAVSPAASAATPVTGAGAERARASAPATSSVAATVASGLPAQPIPAKSVAVLPFENLSTDKGNAYFADGIQDLILTKLADIGDLKVISRTSTAKYASHPDDLKTIGQQLGVAAILEGSVQKAGNQVLINVQLIDAKTDGHIWAQSYQRTLTNIFGVEGEVADKVATALNAKLTAAESTRVASVPTTNPAAYDAYLLGEHYLGEAGTVDTRSIVPKALAAYQAAVAADPKFAQAWARLALFETLQAYLGIDTSVATRNKALADAQRALTLSPNLPDAHLALGYVYRLGFADYDKALVEYRLAEQEAPNSAMAAAAIGYLQGLQGDARGEVSSLQRASLLDPRNVNIVANLATSLMDIRKWSEARVALRRVAALAPEDTDYVSPAQVEVLQHGDVAAALAQLARAPAALQSHPNIVAERVYLLQLKRDYPAALAAAAGLPAGFPYLVLRAQIAELAGHADEARRLYAEILSRLPALPGALTPMWLERGNRHRLFHRIRAEAALGHKAVAYAALHKFVAFARQMGCVSCVMGASYLLARLDARFRDASGATAILTRLLETDGSGRNVSVPLLRLDPVWDPIRRDPRFQALLKKYANSAPAAASSAAGRG